MPVYDAAIKYQANNIPLIILAGKEYGSGSSSRDWAAKGPKLLGVKVVIAESFEKIHRSNLIGMGIIPLQFTNGETANSLNLDDSEIFNFDFSNLQPQAKLKVIASKNSEINQINPNKEIVFTVENRIDTPKELDYYQSGDILPYVLQNMGN